jgi:hypothetical protein
MSYYDPYYDPYYASGYEGYPAPQPFYQPTPVPVPPPPPPSMIPISQPPSVGFETPSVSTSVTTIPTPAPSLMDSINKYKYIIIGGVCLILIISIILSVVFFTSSPAKKPTPNEKLNTSTTSTPQPAKGDTTPTPQPAKGDTTPTTSKPINITPSSVFCNDTNLKNIILKYPYWISNDHIAAVNILANISGTVPSTLQSMSNEQLYKQLKSKCQI